MNSTVQEIGRVIRRSENPLRVAGPRQVGDSVYSVHPSCLIDPVMREGEEAVSRGPAKVRACLSRSRRSALFIN